MYTINCNGRLISLDHPLVMGIINITPDSFYAGSRVQAVDDAVKNAAVMIGEGAAMIDIGGQSTRPGSLRISPEEERARVVPVITALHHAFPEIIISIDTYSAVVAEAAVKAGAGIINDISSGDLDPAILEVAAKYCTPFICMHMQGTPDKMQQNPVYHNVTAEVIQYLSIRRDRCIKAGIKDVLIDPGFGFGKTIQHNFQLLQQLKTFQILNAPLLVGLSRKSTVYKTLGVTPGESLNGTTVLHTIALLNKAQLLRVHDVKAAVEAVKLVQAYAATK